MNAHDAICKAAHDALCKVRTPHANHVWSSPVPFFDYVADEIEAAVSAAGYSITLTDDGAAAPPADSTGVGAPAAAESATTTAAPSSPHLSRDAVMAHYHSQFCEYDGMEDGVEVCAGECREFVDEVGEGATPAINREALTELVASRIHGSDHDQAATKCPGSEFCQLWFDAEQAASKVLPLIEGAS